MHKWSTEQAWGWHAATPWLVGVNFIPSVCINNIEIWQEEGFEQVLAVMDRELALAQATGFNSVRMQLPFFIWQQQRQGFLQRLARFLDLLEAHGMTMMPIFFDDCCMPKPVYSPPYLGKQPDPVPGHHGGTVITPFDGKDAVGYNFVDEPALLPELEEYVRELITAFGQDERIVVWDIWNEPGNSNRQSRSLPIMQAAFGWARQLQPRQPLTACCWGEDSFVEHKPLLAIEQHAIKLSDVVSFHSYGDLARTQLLIEDLKQYGRPLLITEWLHRPFGNEIATHLPLFKREKIGCYNWGLVNGKTQTHEPWDVLRSQPGLDLSRWQHDLFYGDGTAYDVSEIALIRQLTR